MESPYTSIIPLFRDFLLSRAKSTFPKESLSVLCSRASTLLEEAGQAESAVLLLRDMNDWDGLVRLITKHAPLMAAQGRFRPLEDWLNSLPMEIMESNPWLLYWMGACQLPFAPSQSQLYFKKAFELFKNGEDVAGIFLAWSGVVDSILSGFEDFKPLDQWISSLDQLMHDFKAFPSEQIRAVVAPSMFPPWFADSRIIQKSRTGRSKPLRLRKATKMYPLKFKP